MSDIDALLTPEGPFTWPWYGHQDSNYDPDSLGEGLYGPGLLVRLLNNQQGDPINSEQLTVASSAVGLVAIPDMARSATITVETVAVRLLLDGKVPTSTKGLLIPASTIITLTGRKSLKGALFISSAGSTTIDAAYFD